MINIVSSGQAVVVNAFNPRTQELEEGRSQRV